MNRLEITSDGRYRWGGKTGRVVEVLPWHHQPGRRYYRVVHSSGSEYDFYHADGDRLVILFGGVGGHASTGTRLAGGTTSTPSVGARPGVTSATQDLGRGDTRSDRRAQPQSPNGNPLGVEWVGGGNANGSGSPRPSGNNPLGVEWVGGGNANGSGSPRPSSNNPLGVEWVGGGNAGPTLVDQNSKQSRPAGPAPRGPEPVEPTPTSAENLRSALTDRWLYQAVAFVDGTGTVAESRGVSGSLVFHSEGSYEQALSIGGILNAIKGSYRVTGTRMVMSYQWGGKASSDVLTIHLDDSGDKLTLVRQGSPTAYYTLRRAK